MITRIHSQPDDSAYVLFTGGIEEPRIEKAEGVFESSGFDTIGVPIYYNSLSDAGLLVSSDE